MVSDPFPVVLDREWILTNGLGGYALGFGNGLNRRKYNGLLIAGEKDLKRIHVLASVEEKVEGPGFGFFLDANHYSNCIYPSGDSHIVRSWLRPHPSFLYSTIPSRKDVLILKEIFLCEGKNAVVIRYANLGKGSCQIFLRPKFTLRDHHEVNRAGLWDSTPPKVEVEGNSFAIQRPDNGHRAYGYWTDGEIRIDTTVYRQVYYPLESMRGYDAEEDLLSPVVLEAVVSPGESVRLVVAAEPLEKIHQEVAEAEGRYKRLPLPSDHPEGKCALVLDKCFEEKEYRKILEFAAGDFLLTDDIVAGYPWFGCWSRDTLIAMGGLKYLPQGSSTKGSGLAGKILKKYGGALHRGLLPNTFGEGGAGQNYDSVDAPLWYVLRALEYAPWDPFCFQTASRIVLHYMQDTSLPFFMDQDGLIEIRRGHLALTWMDAKVYNVPVTPRWGKPVEINALWFNALNALREMAKTQKAKEISGEGLHCGLSELDRLIEKVHRSLQKFTGDSYLADTLEGDEPVWDLRPNAVIAVSLPFDFLGISVLQKIWETAREQLWTPYGLRTLDPNHPAFKQKYIGNQKQRDLAYHQGTVWPWLLLPMARLAKKINQEQELHQMVWAFREGFMRGEMASVAEVWDGIDPVWPKGCPAQAWSVFALLEIESLL